MVSKKFKIRLSVTSLLLIGLFILMHGCMRFRTSDSNALKEFKNKKYKPHFHTYKVETRTIHYVECGNDSLPAVIFIHGSPGSWDAFKEYMKDDSLLRHVRIIAADRPGFGYSDFGNSEPSLKKQAEALKPLIIKEKKKVILAGHSYGGPVVGRMAIDFPENIGGLLFIAGSIDPELEKLTWYQNILYQRPLKWLVPTAFRVSGEEIVPLKKELEEMLPDWEKIKVPVIVLQGNKDVLVPKENADFAEKKLVNAPKEIIRIENENHFIPWTKPQMVRDAVLKLTKLRE
jgi:pimeloyl-ACP methyl ester carboxylesterase